MALPVYYHSLLIASFLLLYVTGEWNTLDFQRREHSLVRPYQGSGMGLTHWDFLGSTMLTSNFVRLTPDRQSKAGAIWNSVPCFVQNWEVHLQFKVHGGGKTLFGDGFAFWYTKERMNLGPVFGNADPFTGLAIFLDTYSNHNGPHNHNHPYVSAMVSNGTLKYDHDSDGTHTQLSGCEAQFRNRDYDTYLAIRYEDNNLKVSIDIDNKSGWRECFSVSGIKLPVGYFFGASAATGELADNHDIISVKFYELESESDKVKSEPYFGLPEADKMELPREHKEDIKSSYSGWKLFFFIFILVVIIAGGSVVGFLVYTKQQENSRKRFY